jgi:hypothetical protein
MTILRGIVLVTTLSLVAVAVAHGALTSNTDIPSSFTFFDQCSGEDVAVTGTLQVVSTATLTGNTLSGTFHSNFKATGTGQTTGLAYQEAVVASSSFVTSLINGQATSSFVGRITIAAPGAQNNQVSPIFMHTTMNAAGDVTSLKVEPPTVVCQ